MNSKDYISLVYLRIIAKVVTKFFQRKKTILPAQQKELSLFDSLTTIKY